MEQLSDFCIAKLTGNKKPLLKCRKPGKCERQMQKEIHLYFIFQYVVFSLHLIPMSQIKIRFFYIQLLMKTRGCNLLARNLSNSLWMKWYVPKMCRLYTYDYCCCQLLTQNCTFALAVLLCHSPLLCNTLSALPTKWHATVSNLFFPWLQSEICSYWQIKLNH